MIVELLIFFIFLLFVDHFLRKPKNLPPGKWGLPLIGYPPLMKKRFVDVIEQLHRKYGDLFHVKMGSLLFIVVADFPSVKELFSSFHLAARPDIYTFNIFFSRGDLGIVTSNGNIWNTNRRFALRTLRDFGLGKSKMENILVVEAESLVQCLEKMADRPTKIDWALNVALLNVTWRLVADKRYEIDDPKIKQFSQYIYENVLIIDGPVVLFNFLPWLKRLIPSFIQNSWMGLSSLEERRDLLRNMMFDIVNEHRKTLDPSNPRDYIDAYLIEMEKQKNNPDYAHFGDDDLNVTMFNLFDAGSETTASTLRWFFAYMAKYKEVQKMVQDQIDSVVPRDRIPNLDDKRRLPYLEALTHEINRKVSLLPTSIPHEATEDIPINGYVVPKGAWVIPYAEKCHSDPKYWERPDEFYIGHFLDKDGKFAMAKESYIPFSYGRRICPGESLAKMGLYFFMGAILQNFEICEPEGENIILACDENVSVVNYCLDFRVVLKKRE